MATSLARSPATCGSTRWRRRTASRTRRWAASWPSPARRRRPPTCRFVAKPGTPAKATDGQGATSDPSYALIDPKTKQPVENGARNLWVTETALTTALNTSYMAQQLSLFGMVVGVALLLAGIGFGILALGGALEGPSTAFNFLRKREAQAAHAAL